MSLATSATAAPPLVASIADLVPWPVHWAAIEDPVTYPYLLLSGNLSTVITDLVLGSVPDTFEDYLYVSMVDTTASNADLLRSQTRECLNPGGRGRLLDGTWLKRDSVGRPTTADPSHQIEGTQTNPMFCVDLYRIATVANPTQEVP